MAKNLCKINRLDLLRIARRWHNSPQAAIRSEAQPVPSPETKGDGPSKTDDKVTFTKGYNKNSAISLLWEQNQWKHGRRVRLELERATMQLNKSNQKLRQHYMEMRQEQEEQRESHQQKFPAAARKLMEIMSQRPDLSRPYQRPQPSPILKSLSSINKNLDFKPQSTTNVNKWRLKIPGHKSIRMARDESSPIEVPVQGTSKRNRKPIKFPSTTLRLNVKTKPQHPKMSRKKSVTQKLQMEQKPMEDNNWHIGAVCIPQLDI